MADARVFYPKPHETISLSTEHARDFRSSTIKMSEQPKALMVCQLAAQMYNGVRIVPFVGTYFDRLEVV